MGGRRGQRPPTWSPIRLARRSALGHRRGQTLALVAVSALITACTAFAPIYDRAMQQALVDTLLANASTDELVVSVAVGRPRSTRAARPRRETRANCRRWSRATWPHSSDRRCWAAPPVVTPVRGDVPPTGPLVWRDGACEHVRVLSGTCPAAPGEILVSEADVENFGLVPGRDPQGGDGGRRADRGAARGRRHLRTP